MARSPQQRGVSLPVLHDKPELWHARERKDGASVYTVRDYESFRTFYAATFDRADSPVKGQRELVTR